MTFNYYEAPSNDIFNDIKINAIRIFIELNCHHDYVFEKISKIIEIQNVRDNYAFIVAMLDVYNQSRLKDLVKQETRELLNNII